MKSIRDQRASGSRVNHRLQLSMLLRDRILAPVRRSDLGAGGDAVLFDNLQGKSFFVFFVFFVFSEYIAPVNGLALL